MLFVQAFHPGDFQRSIDFFMWVSELDEPKTQHRCLLVASSQCNQDMMNAVNAASRLVFPNTHVIKQRNTVEGKWPVPQNEMFKLAAAWVEDQSKCPWMWGENDSAPLKSGWLEAIEEEYHKAGKPFMGCIYPWISESVQRPHLNGNAVYPAFIRKYNPMMLQATDIPWDVFRCDITMIHSAGTSLIHNDPGDRNLGSEGCDFPTVESLTKIPTTAVYFHRCKNGSLIARLRDVRNPNPSEPVVRKKPKHMTLVGAVKHKIHAMINGANTFMHAGNLGDVVYALPAIRAFSGGDLTICPEQRKTAICSVPINKEQFEMFLPLLKEQPYLRKIEWSEKYPSTTVQDLNHFRNAWIDRKLRDEQKIHTLCQCHFWDLGIADKYKEDETWLTIPEPISTGKIVIHRSPRYNSHDFPWERLIQERRKDLLFVGLNHEHTKFQEDFKTSVSFMQVRDFLELARLIAGARACVMNQSFPLSIAIGCGQKVICEAIARSPDCQFHRPTYTDQLLTPPDKLDFSKL